MPKAGSKKKEKVERISLSTVKSVYHFTDKMIQKYLPEPELVKNPHYSCAAPMRLWPKSVVEEVANSEEVKAILAKKVAAKKKREDKKSQERQKIRNALLENSLDNMISACNTHRKFVVHVGPTNSGKTYAAMQALKQAGSGVYLGPLRLLALEMYDTLNADGVPCTLLTGEERIEVPFAKATASTIEMCDYGKHYEVAVIDETQLIADKDRGGHWTKAIIGLNADEIHVCVAPEGCDLVCNLIKATGCELTVVEHERLAPLSVAKKVCDIRDVQKGDALIAFSRRSVLALAAELERRGIKASVIYGALPPDSRREEVRRFVEGETTVVVATDAIGMGISIPIRRVIFTEAEKFDGTRRRMLNASEVRQIAGRAGRFGLYDEGFVSTFVSIGHIRKCMLEPIAPIKSYVIPFPTAVLDTDAKLEDLLKEWSLLPRSTLFERASVANELELLTYYRANISKKDTDKKFVYSLISCPVNADNQQLIMYWLTCCQHIVKGEKLEAPCFPQNNLQDCETAYKAYDIYHQMSRRAGDEVNCLYEKGQISAKINSFLKIKKEGRTCSRCGKRLPYNYPHGICQRCYNRSRQYSWDDDFYF